VSILRKKEAGQEAGLLLHQGNTFAKKKDVEKSIGKGNPSEGEAESQDSEFSSVKRCRPPPWYRKRERLGARRAFP